MQFPTYPNILLIGGATRNVGKTTLTCRIIEYFSAQHNIVALKIKTVRKGEEKFHGKGQHVLDGGFLISEESFSNPDDTGKMFDAGATQVFHIKTQADSLHDAVSELLGQFPPDQLIVCESNSLRSILSPSVFLLIKNKNAPQDIKPSAAKLQHLANQIIWTDGHTHDFQPHQLNIHRHTWQLI